jgi:hypothetical protein
MSHTRAAHLNCKHCLASPASKAAAQEIAENQQLFVDGFAAEEDYIDICKALYDAEQRWPVPTKMGNWCHNALTMACYAIRDNREDGAFPISVNDLKVAIAAYIEHAGLEIGATTKAAAFSEEAP